VPGRTQQREARTKGLFCFSFLIPAISHGVGRSRSRHSFRRTYLLISCGSTDIATASL
jgi:hypothetical protein